MSGTTDMCCPAGEARDERVDPGEDAGEPAARAGAGQHRGRRDDDHDHAPVGLRVPQPPHPARQPCLAPRVLLRAPGRVRRAPRSKPRVSLLQL
eukprot:652845-Rhodomonas_salina.11